jgi:hypothetical protein
MRSGRVPCESRGVEPAVGGLQHHETAVRARLAGVDQQVHQHLLDLGGIDLDRPQLRSGQDLQLDDAAGQARQHGAHPFDDGVEIDHFGLHRLLPAEGEETADQRRHLPFQGFHESLGQDLLVLHDQYSHAAACCYHGTVVASHQEADMDEPKLIVERIQTGVRMEKRLVKVLKALAELYDISLGDLLEGIVLHAFEGKSPFSEESLRRIADLKKIYGLDLDAGASHRLTEASHES